MTTQPTEKNYIATSDATVTKTANKVSRRDANADLLVATTPSTTDSATSKTYVDSFKTRGNGSLTIPGATGNQNIAHGLGRIPTKIKITTPIYGLGPQSVGFVGTICSVGVYNGTTTSTLYVESGRNYPSWVSTTDVLTTKIVRLHSWDTFYSSDTLGEATVTFDATNIIINWSSVGYTGTKLLWEAE